MSLLKYSLGPARIFNSATTTPLLRYTSRFIRHRSLNTHRNLFRPLVTMPRISDPDQRRSFHDDKSFGTIGSKPGTSRFSGFDLTGGVYIVTCGAQGLGLSMAEGAAEAGGTVYCLDRQEEAGSNFSTAIKLIPPGSTGSLLYSQVDVTDTKHLDGIIQGIADKHGRLDGCITAASINHVTPATSTTVPDTNRLLAINFTGTMQTATSCARAIQRHSTPHASIILIASMSGLIANRGLLCPVYNASRAAVTQLARSLAMEWGRVEGGAIRVNAISPGNIHTEMVQRHFDEMPELKGLWEEGNMLGRLAGVEEFRGAGVFLLSKAGSFMTGANLVIDGGYTAW